MQKLLTKLPEIYLVGISARTNNANEVNPELAKISALIGTYFQEQVPSNIADRKNPGVTFCVYTDYESDINGDYTYFIGEEVSTFSELPEGLDKLVIKAQNYAKFTTSSGPMPNICISAWQEIWQMNDEELGGTRNYHADFEVYDERAKDPGHTILDIYIGIDAGA
jgi:predicted transcriptional regulator YdeE